MRAASGVSRTKPRPTRWGQIMVLYRATHQIGMRELAKETGISSATLSRVERGHAMDADTLLKFWTWLQGRSAR